MALSSRRIPGFTLVEVMLVVTIIGLLAVVAMPKFANLVQKSNEAKTRGGLGALRSALSIYAADAEGTYPTDHLESLTVGAKYIKDIPLCDLPPYHPVVNTVSNSVEFAGAALFSSEAGHWFYSNDSASDAFGSREKGEIWVGCNHPDSKGVNWSGS